MEGRTGSTDGLHQAFIQRRSGEPWPATAELTAAPDLDVGALTGELERISNDLMVDITLDETIHV